MKAICYCRVATHGQAALEQQEKELLRYAEKHGLGIDRVIHEYGSANARHRPALQQLLDESKRPDISAVLVCKLSRLHRDVWQLCALTDELSAQNVRIISTLQGDVLLKHCLHDPEWRQIMQALSERNDTEAQ